MRLLIAGAFRFPACEEACARALEEIGCEVIRFSWSRYFEGILGRIENKLVINGVRALALNEDLVKAVRHCSPDFVWIWRGVHIDSETIHALRACGCVVASYNNDDPFSIQYDYASNVHLRRLWRRFRDTIPAYNIHFVYRPVNVDDYNRAGCHDVHVLPPYFLPDRDRPMTLTADDQKRYGCDIVFVGHHEDDGRVSYIRSLVDAGFSVRLFGTGWTRRALGRLGNYFNDVVPVRDAEYAKALCAAKVCLAVFSRLNRDTYTRRTFEIPATRSVMLSEYSDDVSRWFQGGEEVVFFSTPDEMIEKARWLVSDATERARIAAAGYRRVVRDGHDVTNRMRQLLRIIKL